jgi:hypothetical protein
MTGSTEVARPAWEGGSNITDPLERRAGEREIQLFPARRSTLQLEQLRGDLREGVIGERLLIKLLGIDRHDRFTRLSCGVTRESSKAREDFPKKTPSAGRPVE